MELCKCLLSNTKDIEMRSRIIPTLQDVCGKRPDVLGTSPYGPICYAKGCIRSGTLLGRTKDVNWTIIHKIRNVSTKKRAIRVCRQDVVRNKIHKNRWLSNSRRVGLEMLYHMRNWLEIIDHYWKDVFLFYISYIHEL